VNSYAEVEPYVILGACNPKFASQALAAVPSVGVFLPCNVVVRRQGDHTVIEAMDPEAISRFVDDDRLAELVASVRPLIQRAVDAAAG
jgi:uncharacterized protein (DUF302 family)